MLASIMAAAMSTCDSMMIAVAGLFTDNVYRRHWKPDKSESHYVNVSRVVGVLIVLVSIGFAIVTPSIFSGLKTFWQVTASIGIAWFLGMFWRRANAAGAWASFLVAGAVMAYMNYVTKLSATFSFLPLADWEQNLDKPEIAAIKLGIFLPAGLIAGIVVSLITKPPDKKLKDRFFIKLHTHIADDDLLPQRLGDEEPAEQPDEPDTEDAAERPEPGTLEAAFPPEKWLINRWGLLLPVPSKQTWGGFLIACGVMVAIMLGTWLLVSV